MAQVYSVNAVGYVNKTLVPGFQLVANPLDAGTGNNTVGKLFAGVPVGTTLYKYDGAGFTANSYDPDTVGPQGWELPDMTLVPGEGAFVLLPPGANFTVTFVGEVAQGSLSNPLPKGFSIRSSQVPQSGALDQVLKFPIVNGDTIYQYDPAAKGYITSPFDTDTNGPQGWEGAAPAPAVGEAFWVNKIAAANWVREFSVNN
jgi:hypothetical protein